MTVQPIGDRVLLKQLVQNETQTNTGILLPGEDKKKPMGTIKGLGTGDKVARSNLKVGDTVLFEGWGGEILDKEDFGEENLVILSIDKIIARYGE